MSTIKIAEKSDLAGINSVISANQAKQDDIYKFPYRFADDRDVLPTKSQIIFVTKQDDNVIAFLCLHNSDLFINGSTAEFEMVVHPDFRDRDKHYGENLLKHVINYAEKESKVAILTAKVLKRNIPSITLLQKSGFSCDNDGSDGIGYLMRLKIG
jgi:RimJ/RimL family protein N-acetyltransferase